MTTLLPCCTSLPVQICLPYLQYAVTRSRQNGQSGGHSLEPLIGKLCICRLHALERFGAEAPAETRFFSARAAADIRLRYLFPS
jgi:hypothetical protein